LTYSGFSTILSMRVTCKMFHSKIDVPLLLAYKAEIERSIDGIDDISALIRRNILATPVTLEKPVIKVNQVGERTYDAGEFAGKEAWDPTISAFKLMFRWGLRQVSGKEGSRTKRAMELSKVGE